MSHSSEDPFSDGDGDSADRTHLHVPGARLSSPSASDVAVAPHVPRVIRMAAAASRSVLTPTRGYNPKLSVDMAIAHSWAPYATVIRALRFLSLLSLKGDREVARETVAALYGQATPFGAVQRFPAGEVYVCLDHPPFARKMQGIQEPLIQAEAAGEYGDEFANACSSYIFGIGNALDELTRVTRDDDRDAPVLFDRAAFESTFLLTWTSRLATIGKRNGV